MYQFYHQLILRTPAYTSERYREADLQSLLAEPYFKAAVYLASRMLYKELEKKEFDAKMLTPNMVHTLKKYLNRMCFRPTPFGLFSGISIVHWNGVGKQTLLLNDNALKVQAAVSFKGVLKFAKGLLTHELAHYHTYRSNSSLYKVQDEYRYLRYMDGDEKGRRSFIINSIHYQGILKSIVQFCGSDKSKEVIIAFIMKRASVSREDSEAFFEQLVDQQLLVSALGANITGEDYLDKLLFMCKSLHLDTPRIRRIDFLLHKLKCIPQAAGNKHIGSAILSLEQALQYPENEKSALYVNLDKGAAATGGLCSFYQTGIQEGIDCLSRLMPPYKPPGLQSFMTAFQLKFENRCIPLLLALDPELGVGYEDLGGSFQTPKLLQDIEFAVVGAGNPILTWTPAHAMLLEKWSGAMGDTTVLQLTEEDLEKLNARSEKQVLSPSISVLFRVVENKVYIEQAGGASATALLGRFTPLHPDIEEMSKAIAQHEEAVNPNVIFAEIAHLCDEHTANIDRRKAVRGFEIPVLAQSTLSSEQQILLSDLWVRVEGNKVVLFSNKLQKIIVPRLGSAFNYLRNDLAVFRFLCDLQYQGIQANFTFDLSNFFPGMSFYPRVEYKSAILYLATWHLKKEQFISIVGAPVEQGLALLKALANKLKLPRHITVTEHDNQLVFDLESEKDKVLFLHTIKHKEDVVVNEFPFADEDEPVVADQRKKPYIHQFIAALYHQQEVYPEYDIKIENLQKVSGKMRKFVPGSEWLYFKIYCHPSRSNHLLTEILLPVMKQQLRKGNVRQWFYIRYRDPDYHLRVRLLVSQESVGRVMLTLNQILSKLVEKGVIKDIQVAVYERELERYGPDLIEAVEDVFCTSSELIAANISMQDLDETGYTYYRVAFSGLDEIANAFKLELGEKSRLFHQLYQAFYVELDGNKALREQLSVKFREVSRLEDVLPYSSRTLEQEVLVLRKLNIRYQQALEALAQKITAPVRRRKLIADLMHMHLNRLFLDEARKQELVVYYCLWKAYAAALAQAKH